MGIVEASGGKAEHIGKVDEAGGKNGKYIGMVEAPGGKAGADIGPIEEAGAEARGAGQKAEADIEMGKGGKYQLGMKMKKTGQQRKRTYQQLGRRQEKQE